MQPEEVKQDIKNLYAKFAEAGTNQEHDTLFDSPNYAFCRKRYGQTDLSIVPKTARRLACGSGNPLALAGIKPGSKVVDLGCGGGIDVILAAHRVEEHGKVLGIDIVPEMVHAAQQAVTESGLQQHIFFRTIDIEDIYPLPKTFADVVTANGVINLCPDRLTVYKNIFRILKPGGVLVLSDVVLTEDIGQKLRKVIQADRNGCLGRIVSTDDHLKQLTRLSFEIECIETNNLTFEDIVTIASYPDRNLHDNQPHPEELLPLHDKVAVVTIIAKRRPLN